MSADSGLPNIEALADCRSMVVKPPCEKIAAALAKAQAKFTHATRNKENPFFKSKYADLQSCVDACRAALTEQEIAVIQPAEVKDNIVKVQTILMHSSGQRLESPFLELRAKTTGAQDVGSILSYARRYSLCAFIGVVYVDEDDDGAAGSEYASPAKKTATKGKGSGAAIEPEKPQAPAAPTLERACLIQRVTKTPDPTSNSVMYGLQLEDDSWLATKNLKHAQLADAAAKAKRRCIVTFSGNELVSIEKE